MLDSLYISALGMQAQKSQLDVVSNNLANANTPGYKRERVDFGAVLDQRAQQVSAGSDGARAVSGGSLVQTRRDLSQGEFQSTGSALDLAINGSGFMELVLDGGKSGYFRGGALRINADGFLTNADGVLLKSDIRVPASATELKIDKHGVVSARLGNDQVSTELGRIELVSFTNPDSLNYLGGGIFEASSTSAEGLRGSPGESGLGDLMSGKREMANVKLVDEMVTLMLTQRVYELNSKVIQAADEIMGLTNNLRRG